MEFINKYGALMISSKDYIYRFPSSLACDANKPLMLTIVEFIQQGDSKAILTKDTSAYAVYRYEEHDILIVKHPIQQSCFIIYETPTMYEQFVRPYITEPSWISNIFAGEAEQDCIYIKDKDYYLMPNPKWNRGHEIYLLAILVDSSLCSLRDLRGEHIALLTRIRSESLLYIKHHYGVDIDQLKIYIHYYPSAWRLHIHFEHIKSDKGQRCVGRAHLLSSVLVNLAYDTYYYRDLTIECDIAKSWLLLTDGPKYEKMLHHAHASLLSDRGTAQRTSNMTS